MRRKESAMRWLLCAALLAALPMPAAGQITITRGSTVTGSLTSTSSLSARRPGAYADYYTFSGNAGDNIAITLTSTQFDTYLYLEGPGGVLIAENDDSGLSSDSRIPPQSGMLTLPATGVYRIEVTSYATNTFGTYTLVLDGDCVPPLRGVIRHDLLHYVTEPDANGARLLAGEASTDRVNQILAGFYQIPLPAYPNQRFCGALDIAPGVRAEVFVPTAAEKGGNYSQSGLVVWDPMTRQVLPDGTEQMMPFPGNIVPLSRLQPGTVFAWRLANLLPSNPGVSPPQPAAGNTSPQTFTFRFTSAQGYQNLGVLNILLNNFLDGRHACYLAYVQPQRLLYLVNDAGDGLLPAITLNGSGSIGNSQCTIYGAGSSAVHQGNTVTLTLNMSFSSAFAGNKVWYLAARDVLENNSGWQALGTWSVPTPPPTNPRVVDMSPSRGSWPEGNFTFRFADDAGWQNLGVVNMLLNDFLDGRRACYLAYARPINVLYLVNDTGDGLLPGLVVNGTGSLSNGQCTVSNPTATGSGNTLTISMKISFPGGFAGNRIWYLAARDVAERNSGWQAMGSWTVE